MEKLLWNAVETTQNTGLSRTTIWRLEQRGEFPARRQITPQRVAWVADEVREWVRTRPTPQATERAPAGDAA